MYQPDILKNSPCFAMRLICKDFVLFRSRLHLRFSDSLLRGDREDLTMRQGFLRILLTSAVLQLGAPVLFATDVPVPATCTPQVNQKLGELLASQQTQAVDNVMVCGITVSASRAQHGGPHGSH